MHTPRAFETRYHAYFYCYPLPLDIAFPPGPSPVLRRIWMSASAIPYSPLNYLLLQGQSRRPYLPPASPEFTPKIGYKNSYINSTTGSYNLSRFKDPALSQRMRLQTVNYSQLPFRYRYDTGTNTFCGTRPYRTLQYVRYKYFLKAHLGHGLRDTLVHRRNEDTSQMGVLIKHPTLRTHQLCGWGGGGSPPLPLIHLQEDWMHILHTLSREGFLEIADQYKDATCLPCVDISGVALLRPSIIQHYTDGG